MTRRGGIDRRAFLGGARPSIGREVVEAGSPVVKRAPLRGAPAGGPLTAVRRSAVGD